MLSFSLYGNTNNNIYSEKNKITDMIRIKITCVVFRDFKCSINVKLSCLSLFEYEDVRGMRL